MRQYHIVAINERTGAQTQVTGYPMNHAKCCVMLAKFTQHSGRRLMLVEVPQ